MSTTKLQTTKRHYQVIPGGTLRGEIRVPGDKSISHRSIMLGSLAEGETRVNGFLEGEDSLATLNAFRAMGVEIEGPEAGRVRIKGVGMHGLSTPETPLDLGNSGTSMRLLSGLLAGSGVAVTLTGDHSLSSRPMGRVIDPLREMGAKIDSQAGGTAPLALAGEQQLKGIDYKLPMASAQVKSAILLAGLYAEGETCVTEPAPTRDHTERMLQGFGYRLQRNGAKTCLQGGGKLTACEIDVPADISSATFFMVGAVIAKGSEVRLQHVGINPTRDGVISILRLMGADIELHDQREIGGEPVADIVVRSSQLKGIDIPQALVPLAIDEFPAIFIAAACAQGETRLQGAEELRVKESDRIQVMADGLVSLGVQADPTADGIRIKGGAISGGQVQSHGDHRIAMSFAMAGLVASGAIEIVDVANVNTSFPGFVDLVSGCGLNITEVSGE
ncbi:MAG: 3-phosphoshikimate 1-carboxyvinyltransferase [Candidatus Thiodiazotropha sp.]